MGSPPTRVNSGEPGSTHGRRTPDRSGLHLLRCRSDPVRVAPRQPIKGNRWSRWGGQDAVPRPGDVGLLDATAEEVDFAGAVANRLGARRTDREMKGERGRDGRHDEGPRGEAGAGRPPAPGDGCRAGPRPDDPRPEPGPPRRA